MPRRGTRRRKPPVGDPTDPQGMAARCAEYLEWMRIKNYSERTVENRAIYLAFFLQWAEDRGVTKPVEVTKPILERYQRHLYHFRKPNGGPLSFRSQYSRLVPIRAFFKWLARQNHLLYNPASELELPRLEHRLPKHVLTASEAEAVLAQPDVDDPLGLRDRALLETLYSTGMRRMELAGLALYDLDVERGTLMVRQGKGKKDRMVPIGERAIAWIEKYLGDVRPQLVVEPDEGVLFLTATGEAFTPNRLTQLVRDYVTAAAIGKTGACHLFRHTMATLMLEHGADIRFIQQMLGHAKLETTQIYTQVSIRKLKEIHTATHPGAKLERHAAQALPLDDDDTAATRDELLSSLAAEGAEEEEDG
jgi:integrase/recombinase XerD